MNPLTPSTGRADGPGLNTYASRYAYHRLERTDGVLEIRMHTDDGPVQYNRKVHSEWANLWSDVGRDPDTRVIILTGSGDTFIDRKKGLPGGKDRASRYSPAGYHRLWDESVRHVTDLVNIPVPVIAALNGPARVHAEVALFSDVVIATPDAVIQDSPHLPEQVVPGDGINIAVPYLLGRLRSSYFFYMGQRIDAQEGLRLGLINEIVTDQPVLERAREIAAIMCLQPDHNLRYTRLLLMHDVRTQVHDLISLGMGVEGLASLTSDWQQWDTPSEGDWTSS